MATKDHVAGYAKYFGSRFANLSPEATTEEQIKDVYKEWASKFDEVIPYSQELSSDIVSHFFQSTESINPFTPNSKRFLISPYSIPLESNLNVMRIMEMITNKKPDGQKSSPWYYYRKCREIGAEKMNTNVRESPSRRLRKIISMRYENKKRKEK